MIDDYYFNAYDIDLGCYDRSFVVIESKLFLFIYLFYLFIYLLTNAHNN